MDLSFSQAVEAFARAGLGRQARGDPARANASTAWEKDKRRPNPLNTQGGIRWLRGKSIEYEREPLRLRDLIKGKREF